MVRIGNDMYEPQLERCTYTESMLPSRDLSVTNGTNGPCISFVRGRGDVVIWDAETQMNVVIYCAARLSFPLVCCISYDRYDAPVLIEPPSVL